MTRLEDLIDPNYRSDEELAAEGWRRIERDPPGDDVDSRVTIDLRDNRTGEEVVGRRATFNNSGYRVDESNREFWPTHWRPRAPA